MNTHHQQERPNLLCVVTKTWSRDSHGLYDYESTQTKQAHNLVFDSNMLLRKKNDIRVTNAVEDAKEDEYLMDLKYEKLSDKFFLSNLVSSLMLPNEKNINELQNKIWYVIKHDEGSGSTNTNSQNMVNKNEDYYICLNDIVKLGRVKYAANEINIRKQGDLMDVDNDCDMKQSPYNISTVNNGTKPVFDFIYRTATPPENILEEITCKYCLAPGSDDANPLVELCKCTGGIKYSHYLCLKQWMQTKLSKKENERKTVTSYNIKAFNCEICKTPYPFRFVINGISENIYDLIEIVRPANQNYIILESLNQLKENNNLKSIHVIVLDDQKINLGRGHESDVRINDISVSRTHAVLIYNPFNGKLCIRDLKSKFGTLVLMKSNIHVREKKIHLQIGRSYVEASTLSNKDFEKMKKHSREKKSVNSPSSSSLTNLNLLNINNHINYANINGNNLNNIIQQNPFEWQGDPNDDMNSNNALGQFIDLSKFDLGHGNTDKNSKK